MTMTNQERALSISAKLAEAEKAASKLPPSPQKDTVIASMSALHAELMAHATATANELGFDVGALSFGGNKN